MTTHSHHFTIFYAKFVESIDLNKMVKSLSKVHENIRTRKEVAPVGLEPIALRKNRANFEQGRGSTLAYIGYNYSWHCFNANRGWLLPRNRGQLFSGYFFFPKRVLFRYFLEG
jgi:hypothetical protein